MTETIEWGGDEYSAESFRAATELMANASASAGVGTRGEIIKHLGKQYSGDREIYEVLGYETEITEEQYRAKFRRQDVAERIIKLPPNDTWQYNPRVTDDPDADEPTDFESEVNTLAEEQRLFHYLRRVDIASRIGEYGVLFLGFDDDADLDEEPSDVSELSYMSPFAQDNVERWVLGKERDATVNDPRYNMPVEYGLNFGEVDSDDDDIQDVHWKRVIHIAEDTVESDLKGTPALRAIYNRLEDRQKVLGASAEMFWTGADQKYHFDIDSENAADIPDDELGKLDDEVQKLVHDMEPYLKTFNTDLEVLDGQEVDPSGVIDAIDRSISMQTGIPQRILTGSEQGELASTQDRATHYGRIQQRQNQFAEQSILRPVIDRLVEFEVLPNPNGYTVEWQNLFELNDLELSEVMENRAQALARLAPQGNTDLVADAEELFKFVVDGNDPDFGTGNDEPMSEQQNQPSQSDPTEAER